MKTDTSEKGLEALIVADMTARTAAQASGGFSEAPEPFVGLHNWILGDPKAYDRGWSVDLVKLRAFISVTQPPLLAALDLDNDSPARQKFLARLQGEIGKRGVIEVLRNGRPSRRISTWLPPFRRSSSAPRVTSPSTNWSSAWQTSAA